MRINNNITAINAHRNYTVNNSSIGKNVEKLSSGYRINRAGDDAAGLAISEKMRAQIRGLTMASKNSQDAISLVQTAEGALQESHNILQRMRELAVQSASDTNETVIDRGALQLEFAELIKELDDTASKAKFNDQGLIDGTFSKTITAAVSDKTSAHKMVWASNSVLAGTYDITVSTIVNQAAVTGVKSEATMGGTTSASTGITVTSSAGGVTVEWEAGTNAGVESDTINGVWNFTMIDRKIVAENQNTGEKMTREFQGIAGTGSVEIDFGALGKFTITGAASDVDIKPGDFTSFSASVQIKGGVAAKEETVKYVATMGNDQIVLETGMTTLNFTNTGISVNLKNAVNANDTTGTAAIANALSTMDEEIAGEITVTKSNGKALVIQTGANQGDELAINLDKMDAYTLGVSSANVANRLDASAAITQVNTALNLVSTQRAGLGALQNRLDHKIANLDTSAENLQAAESRIRDVDMAKEMTSFTKNNILFQASTAMLAQANALPQGVLQLLG